jgi:hypothetical protein
VTVTPGPAGSATPCDGTTAGTNDIHVFWTQQFFISIPFMPPVTIDKLIEGVFRCE